MSEGDVTLREPRDADQATRDASQTTRGKRQTMLDKGRATRGASPATLDPTLDPGPARTRSPASSRTRAGAQAVHPRGAAPARGLPAGPLLRACRPRQWSKNLLVLAAPCAAGVIDRPLVAAQVAGAFVVMCLLSSATYLINDVRDAEQDRLHPRKRLRPVAGGELAPRTALRAAAALALVGLAAATAIAPGLGAVGCCYLALTASYSLWLRRVIVLDIVAVAAGFVLRAVAGGVATDIYLSRWFVIVTGCCAVFLVTAKRYAELREHGALARASEDDGSASSEHSRSARVGRHNGPARAGGPAHADPAHAGEHEDPTRAGKHRVPARATLRRYSPRQLRTTLLAAATLAGVAYTGWAFTRPAHLAWYGLSIVPFVMWFVRYAVLIGAGAGQAPEELILRDRVLLALGATWSLLFLGGVYAAG